MLKIFKKKNKSYYLKTNKVESHKQKKLKKFFDTSFFRMMKNNEIPINIVTFIVLSIGCSFGVYFFYTIMIKSQVLAIGVGIMSITIPYLVFKPTMMLKKFVDDAIAYKAFIFSLESALRATNSTTEAFELVCSESNIHPSIQRILDNIMLNLKLGESIDKVLKDAIEEADDVYIKMAFTIIKINHSIGSSTTVNSLENIQKSMDFRIDDIQLLKSKIDSLISEKSIFLALILVCPIFLNLSLGSMLSSIYENQGVCMMLLLVYIFAFAGQFIIGRKADKMVAGL